MSLCIWCVAALESPTLPLPPPIPTPASPQSFSCLHTFDFSRMPQGWSPTSLSSFTPQLSGRNLFISYFSGRYDKIPERSKLEEEVFVSQSPGMQSMTAVKSWQQELVHIWVDQEGDSDRNELACEHRSLPPCLPSDLLPSGSTTFLDSHQLGPGSNTLTHGRSVETVTF